MIFYCASEGELFKEKDGEDSNFDINLDTSVGNDSQHRGSVKIEAASYSFVFGVVDSIWIHVEFLPQPATSGGTDTAFMEIRDVNDNYIVRFQDDYNNGTTNNVKAYINDGSNTVITSSDFTTTANTFHTIDVFINYADQSNIEIKILFDKLVYSNYKKSISGIFGKPAKLWCGDRSSTSTEDAVWYRDIIVSNFPTIGWKLCTLEPVSAGSFSSISYEPLTKVNLDAASVKGINFDEAVSWVCSSPTIPAGYQPYALAITTLTYTSDIETYDQIQSFIYNSGSEVVEQYTNYTENESWHVFSVLFTENVFTKSWSSDFYSTVEIGVKNAD